MPSRAAISTAEFGTARGNGLGCGAQWSTSFLPRGSPSVSVTAAASPSSWHGCHRADSRLTTGTVEAVTAARNAWSARSAPGSESVAKVRTPSAST